MILLGSATLDAIVAKFKFPAATRAAEPTYTLELTGPGIFTDAIRANSQATGPFDLTKGNRRVARRGRSDVDIGPGPGNAAPPLPPPHPVLSAAAPVAGGTLGSPIAKGTGHGIEAPLLHVSRLAGHRYFRHVGQGSWKTYRFLTGDRSDLGASSIVNSAKLPLDPHEVRFLLVFVVLAVLAVAAPRCASTHHMVCARISSRADPGHHMRDTFQFARRTDVHARGIPTFD